MTEPRIIKVFQVSIHSGWYPRRHFLEGKYFVTVHNDEYVILINEEDYNAFEESGGRVVVYLGLFKIEDDTL